MGEDKLDDWKGHTALASALTSVCGKFGGRCEHSDLSSLIATAWIAASDH
jgi:hypothetical protein